MIRTNKELFNYITNLVLSGSDHSFSEHHFAPSQEILIEGKKVFSVYIMKSGMVKCYLTTDTGNNFIQEFFGEGELFGEIELMDDSFSYCTIKAIDMVSVYKIQKSDFLQLLDQDKKFNRLFIGALISKLKYKATRHSYNQSHTIEEKLMRLKMKFPDLEKVISKQDIADYLGITLRALNRTIKAMSAI
ncbi:Crp/Fnr family transcriptional regulator [Pedobacter sp. L105]|uniref:Crp/Fnr family transcriptional regulator n=1 Tax=Pedobacter sp. L105 TaxID=1641871 RepID=UPI00131B64F1|nr:Crp/Fnr family transcriptional regulator [Pedobacter sp. L105]